MAYIGWATHVPQRQKQRDARVKAQAEPQKLPQFGSRFETQAREAETISNRKSARCGEDKPSSAHTAHHARRMYKAGSGIRAKALPPLIALWVI